MWVISPELAGPTNDFIIVSFIVMPTKLFDASVLYPHVFSARAAGELLAEAGSGVPRLSIFVLFRALIYNL